MSRRSNLTSLMEAPVKDDDRKQDSPEKPEASQGLSADKSTPKAPVVARSGAARSMGAIWKATAAQADAAYKVSTDAAIDLDTALLDASIVADRVRDSTDPTFLLFIEDLREHGQRIPILVREHPTSKGRYQIAYGHRRARAARELGRPVRAVVRSLTDPELVLAQASENLERKDLSYIERAFFALNMREAGISRDVIQTAMRADEAQISRYIKVAESVPGELLSAIGPAPKVGRPRWDELVDRIQSTDHGRALAMIKEPGFDEKPTDDRFAAVFAALAPTVMAKSGRARIWKDGSGRKLVRIEETASRFNLSIDRKLEPGFGAYLVERLSEILADYRDGERETDPRPPAEKR